MIIIELNENKDLYSLLYKSLNENNCLLSYNKQKKQKNVWWTELHIVKYKYKYIICIQ